ncbi:response regulator, partial [bacterium]|nr:response regulator [bacterium]
MGKIKILVVEDERITAEDIRLSLLNLGYEVTALVSSGEAALKEVEKHRPSLILMDIVLQGSMDGIVTANKILSQYNIPIVYMTAYSDESTLERVKKTEPFGYILKPFEDQELQGIIEVALYKHQLDRKLRDSEEKFRSLYETMAQGVIYMDSEEEVVSVNPAALNIFKMSEEEVRRQWSKNYNLKVLHEDGTEFFKKDLPLSRALKTGKKIHNVILGIYLPEGKEQIWLKTSAVPQYKPGEKKPYQAYITFDDISERKRSEDALLKYTAQLDALRKIAQELTGLRDLDILLKHILELGVQILGGLGGGIYLYHPATDSLEWAVAVSVETKYLGLTMRRGEGIAGKVLETGQPIIIQDYSKWPGRL